MCVCCKSRAASFGTRCSILQILVTHTPANRASLYRCAAHLSQRRCMESRSPAMPPLQKSTSRCISSREAQASGVRCGRRARSPPACASARISCRRGGGWAGRRWWVWLGLRLGRAQPGDAAHHPLSALRIRPPSYPPSPCRACCPCGRLARLATARPAGRSARGGAGPGCAPSG